MKLRLHAHLSRIVAIAMITATATLSACDGGTSGGTIPPIITPTNPPPTFSVTGTVVEFTAGTPIAGATVTFGTNPTTGTGWASFGSPITPTYTATTAADGTFTISAIPATGPYMLTISKDAAPTTAQTYAILHRTITLAAGTNALGTLKIAILSNNERAWIAQINSDRANVAFPSSEPVVIDEYAQEQARQWAINVDAGTTPYTDAGFDPYQAAYSAKPGALGRPLHVGNISDTWQDAESTWFSEKAFCPNGNWSACASTQTNKDYVNLSFAVDVWAGVGEDLLGTYSGGPFHAFDVIIVWE